jgi:hypothetical protein
MSKLLKFSLFSLLSILLLSIPGSYFSYRSYWAKDPVVEINPTNLYYYHETYDDCREAFIRSVGNVVRVFDIVEAGNILIPSKTNPDLRIDWCYIPARGTKNKLVILNSGLHGIEGYTGSAIQNMFIDRILQNQLPNDMGLLLLHGLNPYGFKYHRRTDESNIDLNRNCIIGGKSFKMKNEGYSKLIEFLMPSGPATLDNLHNRFFYITALYKILKESMPVLRQAALQGQYEFNMGIYYGGNVHEPQIDSLNILLIEKIKDYKSALNVDLHTGYGERGKLHLFIDKPEDPSIVRAIENVFSGSKIDWGNSDDFYTTTGDYKTWINSLVPNVFCIPMLFEFGTLNSQKIFGSLKSMQIMILENQGFHYGYKNTKNEIEIKKLFDEMYFPSSAAWRSKVISDSYDLMTRMIKNYELLKLEPKILHKNP